MTECCWSVAGKINKTKCDMSGKKITEDYYEQVLIEQLRDHLGYDYCLGSDIERTSPHYTDVFIDDRLTESLRRINTGIHPNALSELCRKVKEVYDGDLFTRNQTFHEYLQKGVEINYFDGKEQQSNRFRLLDFDHPLKNDFLVVNQWTIVENENRRPDLVLFVNGIPLVVFELKSPSRENVDTSDAYSQIQHYLKDIPSFFVPNVFVVLSDMADTRVGTITSPEDRFVQWKSADGSLSSSRYRTMLEGMCSKDHLLDIIRNFVCFDISERGKTKMLGGYHQYFAVHKAVESAINAMQGKRKAGIFWHTQGSGKSMSMVFFAHLLYQQKNGTTFVVVTDRNDLDDQLYGQFSRCHQFLNQIPVQAESREDLKNLLKDRAVNGIIFTTMQKFAEGSGLLSDRENIIVMADEAHRSQYGITRSVKMTKDKDGKEISKIVMGNAGWLREALPNASFIGFTGTPISNKDKDTKEIFGNYIDVYDMTQAVEDGATRPVYYESRVVALSLDKEVLKIIDSWYEKALDENEETLVSKSKREQATLETVLSAPQTIESLVDDILMHYETNRADLLTGKAMIVAYNRKIAMLIYKKILEKRPNWKDTVKVVMTGNENDPEEWKKIINSESKEQLAAGFKNTEEKDHIKPFKIAIVVDMWLTGFDVPSLSTMYIFKPMKGHTLMQAIARVNRVYKGKEGGLIVDYVGIGSALKQAMNDYTVRDKDRYGEMDIGKTAYPEFQNHLSACRDFFFKLDYMTAMRSRNKIDTADMVLDGADLLLAPANAENCKRFCNEAKLMSQALSLAKSRATRDEQLEAAYFEAVRAIVVKRLLPPANSSDDAAKRLETLNEQISQIIAQSVKSDGVVDLFKGQKLEFSLFDEAFLKEVASMKHKNLAIEMLRRLIEGKIRDYNRKSIVQAQRFSELFQKALNGYLNGHLTNVEVIEELRKIAQEIIKNRQEAKEMGLNDEEMAFYEAISKPQAVRDFYTHEQLINMTRELTEELRKNRGIDWQIKESARAQMRSSVRRLLKRYKYPPDEVPEATDTVIKQCEIWTDYTDK